MRVEYDRPPNYDEIARRFKIVGKNVLFAWGDTIYNPMRIKIPPHLKAHEEMHGWRQRQRNSVEEWWKDYLYNEDFRCQEEVIAHQVEYRTLVRVCPNRAYRRSALKITAKRLASPLYGRMITPKFAETLLLQAKP